jgi:hypothetical protein
MSTHGKESRARVRKDPTRPRAQRRRKVPVRPKPRRDTRRAVADAPELSALAGLIDALDAEKIRFVVIGMTAAVLQGTPVTTFDVDLWVDLPSRRYIQVMNLARKLGAQMVANTVALLPGDLAINFVYSVAGLHSFGREYSRARRIQWMGRRVAVLPLERIYASKKFVGRPKDLAHLPYLEQTMKLKRHVGRQSGG